MLHNTFLKNILFGDFLNDLSKTCLYILTNATTFSMFHKTVLKLRKNVKCYVVEKKI